MKKNCHSQKFRCFLARMNILNVKQTFKIRQLQLMILQSFVLGSKENKTNNGATKACKRRETVELASVINIFDLLINCLC